MKKSSWIMRVVEKAWFSSNLRTGFANAHTAPYRKSAFTLAEVLITLGIIGIVAAMTMPSLIAHFQERALVTQVKKAYSGLENAFNLHRSQTGEDDLLGIFNTSNTHNESRDALAKYYKVVAKCSSSQTTGCGGSIVEKQMKANKDVDGKNTYAISWGSIARFVTADGMLIGVYQYPDCYQEYPETLAKDGSAVAPAWTRTYCASIRIDVNGAKGPNQAGKDYFSYLTSAQGKIYYDVVTDNTGDMKSVLLNDKLNDTQNYNIGDDYTP